MNILRFFTFLFFCSTIVHSNESKKDTTSVFLLDEIVVTGSLIKHLLKDTPVITEIISQKEIAQAGNSNLADILQSKTGIQLGTSIGQTQNVRLSGLNKNHVLILVDGERITGKVDDAIDIGQIPLNTVEKIEIVKGPLSSIYGSEALGGVVNIITKNPTSTPSLQTNISYGTYGKQNYDFSSSYLLNNIFDENNGISFLLNGGWGIFWGVDYDAQDYFSEIPEYDKKNLNLKTLFQFSNNFSLNTKIDYYQDNLQWLAGGDITKQFVDFSSNKKISILNTAQYSFTPLSTLKFSANYSHNTHTSKEESWLTDGRKIPIRNNSTKEQLQTYRTQFSTAPYSTSILTFGYELTNEKVISDRLLEGKKDFITNIIYGEDEWTFSSATFAVGARYSHNSVFGSFFAPRISTLYKATEELTLRSSYGRGFRSPSFIELFIDYSNPGVGYTVKGNPLLQPEISDGYNIGFDYNRDDIIWFRMNMYYNNVKNLINYYYAQLPGNGTAVLSYNNLAKANTKGIDFDVDINPLENFTIGIGYNYLSAQSNGKSLPFRSPNVINIKLNYNLPEYEFTANILGRWFDKKLVTNEQTNIDIYSGNNEGKLYYEPSYGIIDVRLSKKIWKLNFYGGSNNIFNVTSYPFGQIREREFFIGTQFTLE